MAEEVRNWGRWGSDDELGTLNYISSEKVKESAGLAATGRVFSLGVNFDSSGPQGLYPTRINPLHFVTVDATCEGIVSPATASAAFISSFHGMGPARFNDDYVVMPLQAATQWDALSHVYYDNMLYNGFPASSVTAMGAGHLGIEKVAHKGIISRGVLLDVERFRSIKSVPADRPISPDEIEEILDHQAVDVQSGDILVVRTGWWGRFAESGDRSAPATGLSWRSAEWLHRRQIAAVAADNTQVEPDAGEPDSVPLGFHCLAIRDMGMMLGELWNLEELAEDCASDGVYDFQLVAPPLRVTGAVGTPLNPVAIK